ncbi:hypothetical protein HSR121_0015 [Halapricum desulfuricans]|uniref:Uncharacterized protein n=1 Tax=Halapricum desulfuricans TaxID=2841257 RepID=A0A897MWM5_9EURY|nr:hypothetical protein HSR121_0015 [Halapricum desulfuricans]
MVPPLRSITSSQGTPLCSSPRTDSEYCTDLPVRPHYFVRSTRRDVQYSL